MTSVEATGSTVHECCIQLGADLSSTLCSLWTVRGRVWDPHPKAPGLAFSVIPPTGGPWSRLETQAKLLPLATETLKLAEAGPAPC